MVEPLEIPDFEFRQKWLSTPFKTNSYPFENQSLITQKGELVRSKSELIIANTLNSMNLPYRYECELVLKDGNIFYPDFTILNPKTRNLVYVEHFGMMDNSKYRIDTFKKMETYADNNIFLGTNLIAFFEEYSKPLNTTYLVNILKHFF